MQKNILIIAGEPSGDVRAGEMLEHLKSALPGFSLWGIGGDRMQSLGVELVEHIRNLSMVGVWEVIKKLAIIRRQYHALLRNVDSRKPCLAILVDYPGFNLRAAKALSRRNIPVIYYIVPQFWAWGAGRIKYLKKYVTKAVVLFEFEKKMLDEAGVDCEFAGHPVVDTAIGAASRESPLDLVYPEPLDFARDKRSRGARGKRATGHGSQVTNKHFTIALLPGSREHEIKNLFPVMMQAAETVRRARPEVSFITAENSNIPKTLYDSVMEKHGHLPVRRETDNTAKVLASSDFAIVASGTATLETAVAEKPMVIIYRASPLTHILYRIAARIPFVGLVNITAGRMIVPELLQYQLSQRSLSQKVLEIINDDTGMENMREDLRKVRRSLGEKGASERAARAIISFVRTLKT